MENFTAVRKLLGGSKVITVLPKDELDFIPFIRKGFPRQVFTALREKMHLSDEKLFSALGIAKRTGQRRIRQGERLKPLESELLLRLARIVVAATETFGDEDQAREWLLQKNLALGGAVPIDLLDTGIGFQNVRDLLTRIDYGVYS